MSNFTNYSVFFIIELKYRLFYILFSCFIINLYTVLYLNDFLIQLLEPIEYLNLDLNVNSICDFLIFNIDYSYYDLNSVNTTIVITNISNSVFDHFPIFEINISNNNFLYFKLFCYLSIIFMIPIFLYHFYLFIVPGLYLNEYIKLNKIYCYYILLFYIYFKHINNIILFIYLFITYNNFYEFYNYEFDIEFDIVKYINIQLFFFILYSLNVICLWTIVFSKYKNIFKFFLYIINIYSVLLINSIFIYIYIFFYILWYLLLIYKYI